MCSCFHDHFLLTYLGFAQLYLEMQVQAHFTCTVKRNCTFPCLTQSFLLLDEVEGRNFWPQLGEKQESCVEVEKLTCYWDKV